MKCPLLWSVIIQLGFLNTKRFFLRGKHGSLLLSTRTLVFVVFYPRNMSNSNPTKIVLSYKFGSVSKCNHPAGTCGRHGRQAVRRALLRSGSSIKRPPRCRGMAELRTLRSGSDAGQAQTLQELVRWMRVAARAESASWRTMAA